MTLQLPTSKSISARLLLIKALAANDAPLYGLSDCDDVRIMQQQIACRCSIHNIGASGTAARLLTAYLACRPGAYLLQGEERMSERPVGPLVNALRQLGAQIHYTGRDGYLPLYIEGRQLEGGCVTLASDMSSQFATALLLVAPTMKGGLQLRLSGSIVSRPYIDLTLALMQQYGAQAAWIDPQTIHVNASTYLFHPTTVEPDWSAAGYAYEWMATTAHDALLLGGLQEASLQPDRRAAELFGLLGVETHFTAEGAWLTRRDEPSVTPTIDLTMTDVPDLVPTLAATCLKKGVPFRLSGIRHLRLKESDRLAALTEEMGRLGYHVTSTDDTLLWQGERTTQREDVTVNPHGDHRIAMSLAPLLGPKARQHISDATVVSKSYPQFWTNFESFYTA